MRFKFSKPIQDPSWTWIRTTSYATATSSAGSSLPPSTTSTPTPSGTRRASDRSTSWSGSLTRQDFASNVELGLASPVNSESIILRHRKSSRTARAFTLVEHPAKWSSLRERRLNRRRVVRRQRLHRPRRQKRRQGRKRSTVGTRICSTEKVRKERVRKLIVEKRRIWPNLKISNWAEPEVWGEKILFWFQVLSVWPS